MSKQSVSVATLLYQNTSLQWRHMSGIASQIISTVCSTACDKNIRKTRSFTHRAYVFIAWCHHNIFRMLYEIYILIHIGHPGNFLMCPHIYVFSSTQVPANGEAITTNYIDYVKHIHTKENESYISISSSKYEYFHLNQWRQIRLVHNRLFDLRARKISNHELLQYVKAKWRTYPSVN